MDILHALTAACLNASQTSKNSDQLNRYTLVYSALSSSKSLLTFDLILSVLFIFQRNFNIKDQIHIQM